MNGRQPHRRGRAARRRPAWRRAIAAGVAVWGALTALPAAADSAAVVLMYHRFGESDYPSTNTTLEQLDAHIAELTSGAYTVMAVPDIVAAVREGRPLPDRTVGLTVDDAYLSVYREAWPRLKAAGLPFTLFVATDPVDRRLARYMTWDQIRELAADGVTIGSQTASHLHMAAADAGRNRRDLDRSQRRFLKELGQPPHLFAYPYGEASLSVMTVVREAGFAAAFGQHSGAIGVADDLFYLPRFALNETYGDLNRLRLVANTLPLPVTDVTPADPLVAGVNPPAVGFSVAPGVGGLGRLACFTSHEGQLSVERLGGTRIEVRMAKPLPKGRTRLNCTLPAGDGRWRWLGRQFYVP